MFYFLLFILSATFLSWGRDVSVMGAMTFLSWVSAMGLMPAKIFRCSLPPAPSWIWMKPPFCKAVSHRWTVRTLAPYRSAKYSFDAKQYPRASVRELISA